MNSNRYGESRRAYREVQERHEDIKRIEQTLGELAQLFNDVSYILWVGYISWQHFLDESCCWATRRGNQRHWNASCRSWDWHRSRVRLDKPVLFNFSCFPRLKYTEKAVVSARSARQKRWICFWIAFIVVIIIAVVLGVALYHAFHKWS
jgi:syntaxin 1B/2/3